MARLWTRIGLRTIICQGILDYVGKQGRNEGLSYDKVILEYAWLEFHMILNFMGRIEKVGNVFHF